MGVLHSRNMIRVRCATEERKRNIPFGLWSWSSLGSTRGFTVVEATGRASGALLLVMRAHVCIIAAGTPKRLELTAQGDGLILLSNTPSRAQHRKLKRAAFRLKAPRTWVPAASEVASFYPSLEHAPESWSSLLHTFFSSLSLLRHL